METIVFGILVGHLFHHLHLSTHPHPLHLHRTGKQKKQTGSKNRHLEGKSAHAHWRSRLLHRPAHLPPMDEVQDQASSAAAMAPMPDIEE